MSHIIAVRHGMTRQSAVAGNADVPLSREGHDQMQKVAEIVKTISPNFYVVASDKLRSKQGAEIITDHLGISDYANEPRLSLEKIDRNTIEAISKEHRKNGVNTLFIGHLDFVRGYGDYIFSLFGKSFDSVSLLDHGRGFHADMGNELVSYFPDSN